MILQNKFWYFKSEIPKETCERIIRLGESKLLQNQKDGISVQGTTYGDDHKDLEKIKPLNEKTYQQIAEEGEDITKYYIRDSNVCWLDEQWLYDLLSQYVNAANKNAGWNWNLTTSESIQFTKYENSGFYGWHTDGGSDEYAKYKRYLYGITPLPYGENEKLPNGYTTQNDHIGLVRKISVSLNLTDETTYEGGDLKLDMSNDGVRQEIVVEDARSQGSIIVFPSFLPHCVTPVTKGTRYSLVLWALGEPWK